MNKHFKKWYRHFHEYWLFVLLALVCIIVTSGLSTFSHKQESYTAPALPIPVVVEPEKPAKPSTLKPVMTVPAFPKIQLSSIIVPSIATGTATVTNASPKTFAYAHGTTQAGDRFIVGTANRAGNPYASNKLYMFTDPRFVDRYVTMLLPHQGDIETMVYDDKGKKVYFLLTGLNDFELYSFDPSTLLVSLVASSTELNPGAKPAIVTDGTYVYGITNTTPSVIFKIKISDGAIASNSVGHISNGHSAAIGIYPNSTELYFGGGMSDQFEKVDASSLHSLGKVDLSPCSETDDMPYVQTSDTEGYVYVGCEIQPFGYRVRTSNLSADRFLLPGSSLGIFSFNGDLYNAAQDGNIDLFPQGNLNMLQRFHIASSSLIDAHNQEVEPNELFYSNITDRLYFTAWWGIPGLFAISTSTSN